MGHWFEVLIGACAYVIMRKDDRPLPMAEVASAVDSDVYELGRMILRVIDFLGLKRPDFPEFDIVHSLERRSRILPVLLMLRGGRWTGCGSRGCF